MINRKSARKHIRKYPRLKSSISRYTYVYALIFALGLSALIVNAGNDSANDSISDSAESDIMEDTSGQIEAVPRKTVYILMIEDAIGVVTVKRIEEAIALAEDESAELIVIMLDTPGGFTKATWAIDKAILNSHVPVVVYIAPAGARAGSAGVYITYAAHFAVMAPGTNIGAAHPVSGSGEKIDSVMNEKITNDAVASIKAMAEKRGRNVEWAEKSVRESVSITDLEADSLGVIDFRAHALADLYDSLDGRVAETPSGDKTLELSSVEEITLVESFLERILKIIASPDIAFLLFSIGGLGIVLELYHPGAILPGVVGGISLILAFYAFQTLPINTTGLMLILFAIVLFLVEIKVTSYGLLTMGGIISLSLGGLMLIDTYDPNLQVSKATIYTVAIGLAILLGIVVYLITRAQTRKVSTGTEGLAGLIGEARSDISPIGTVYVNGELWKARSAAPIIQGDEVIVERVEGILLVVKRKGSVQELGA